MKASNFIKKMRKRRGFTLIELMVVLVVLGGLMGLLVGSLQDSGLDEKQTKLQLQTARSKLELALFDFKSAFGRYPRTDEGLEALVDAPTDVDSSSFPAGGFVKKPQILDPWGNVFQYSYENGKYSIVTLGADGQEGGEGLNADQSLSD